MDFEAERKRLVEYISGFAITSDGIKKAVSEVKRENFLSENLKQHAYDDNAAPIGYGQTISQPSTITVMLELLGVKNGMTVLEVGSGSGYVLALLSKLVGKEGKVYGIEYLKELAEASKENLKKEKIENVKVKQGDGSLGWEKEEFDRILISCACPFIPKTLFDQLKEKGRIVAPVGDPGTQVLEILMKEKGKPFKKSYEGSLYTFVPLKGKHGYSTNL